MDVIDTSQPIQAPSHKEHIQDPNLRQCVTKYQQMHFKLDQLPELAQNLLSEDIFQRHYGVIGIRKLLSVGKVLTRNSPSVENPGRQCGASPRGVYETRGITSFTVGGRLGFDQCSLRHHDTDADYY